MPPPSPASPGKASRGPACVSRGDGPLSPWGQWLCSNKGAWRTLSKASTTRPGTRCGAAGTLDSVQPHGQVLWEGSVPRAASRTRPSCEARGSRAPLWSGVEVGGKPALWSASTPASRAPLHPHEASPKTGGSSGLRVTGPRPTRWSVISLLSPRFGPIYPQAQCLCHLTVSPGTGLCVAWPPCTSSRLTQG